MEKIEIEIIGDYIKLLKNGEEIIINTSDISEIKIKKEDNYKFVILVEPKQQ